MTRILALSLAALLPALASAQSSPASAARQGPTQGGMTTWTFDPAHTSSQFAVKHLVVSTVRGQFGKTTGTIHLDADDLARSSVEATVDVSTIDTRNADRDAHLKSADFFDVAKYPTMTFKSTKVVPRGKDRLEVTGDLTIKGTTKPVVFEVTYAPTVVKGMKGELRRGFSATSSIDRRTFGLNWSKMVEAGPVVGDEVQITIDAEAVKADPGDQAKAAQATKAEPKGAPAAKKD